MKNVLCVFGVWCLTLLLAACVTLIDPDLPAAEIPTITVATEFVPVASPAHPTSYLSVDPIAAGSEVRVIGADENAAWLLVEHEGVLGWMPAFYSHTNTGSLEPAFVFEAPADKCTTFLDATYSVDEPWTPGNAENVTVVGSVLRDEASTEFADASLQLVLSGHGAAIFADYVHMPLTEDTAVALFTYTLQDLDDKSEIKFRLTGAGDEPYSFQALHFRDECAPDYFSLPIGQIRGKDSDAVPGPESVAVEVTASPPIASESTPTPIVRESGPKSLNNLDIALTILEEGSDWNIYLREAGQRDPFVLTVDTAEDYFGSWSPDGEQFVFSSDRSGVHQLLVYDMETGRVVDQITNSQSTSWFGSWSPTHPEIAYQEWDGDDWQIWRVRLDSLETRRLTTVGSNEWPTWSPDGKRIAYGHSPESTLDGPLDFADEGHIFVMDADGRNPMAVTEDDSYFDAFPRWMPDGRHVVFTRHAFETESEEMGPGDICIVDLETGQVRNLTFTSANEYRAYPSPFGDQFLILVEENGAFELHLADWNGKRLGRLTYLTDALNSDWRPSATEKR